LYLDCSDISDNAITVIRDEVLSVEETAFEIDLSVFPNPTTDVLNIAVNGINNGYAVTIYSISGRVVAQESFSSANNSMDVTRYANGIYLLEIVDEQTNTRTVKRFIKN